MADALSSSNQRPKVDPDAEPLLRMANIQGNSIVGFKQDFQTLLFFRIDDAEEFRPAIPELGSGVATAAQVLASDLKFKQAQDTNRQLQQAGESTSPLPKATWMNVAFSYAGLKELRNDVDLFADGSFRRGMVERSQALGDPQDPAPGSPRQWKVRDDTAHVMIIVAADAAQDRDAEVERVRELIRTCGGATEVRHEEGSALKEGSGQREHFGFRDGISQPALRGRARKGANDLLAPPAPNNPQNRGKSGQELVWPGEFVFGYPDQDGSRHRGKADWMRDGAGFLLAPEWARDGSYLVFRRFEQDVHAFHESLQPTDGSGTAAEAGARVVGRWASGAPIMRADEPEFYSDNEFDFAESICPQNAHIRKVHPRDDLPAAEDRLRHRLLRRGIPFGPKSKSKPEAPFKDQEKRGLLFLAYMTSIVDQFEFVMGSWANNKDFRKEEVGPDALLDQRWILPTGGGYYFAPSVSALMHELSP
jgi:Dyp-type peroxidase family